eukprot:g23873.t1
MEAQHSERTKTRADEQAAVAKAIEILDADDANANFAKTFSASFLQESQQTDLQRREKAAEVLAKAAQKDTRLAGLLLQMKIDKFEKVKKAIDEMATALKKEQQDEVKQRDFCVDSFQKNQVETEEKTSVKKSLVAKEGTITMEIQTTGEEMDLLTASIADLKKQMEKASQNREAENKEFQTLVTEQRETQRLLKDALTALKEFYMKNPAGSMIQLHRADPKTPDARLGSNGQSFGVMSLLQQLVSDAEAMESEATRADQSAQKAYEKFAADTQESVESKEEALADKSFMKAGSEKSHVQTKQSREGVETELEGLASTKADLHEPLAQRSSRGAWRGTAPQEIESIAKAKAILSGASFSEIQLD